MLSFMGISARKQKKNISNQNLHERLMVWIANVLRVFDNRL